MTTTERSSWDQVLSHFGRARISLSVIGGMGILIAAGGGTGSLGLLPGGGLGATAVGATMVAASVAGVAKQGRPVVSRFGLTSLFRRSSVLQAEQFAQDRSVSFGPSDEFAASSPPSAVVGTYSASTDSRGIDRELATRALGNTPTPGKHPTDREIELRQVREEAIDAIMHYRANARARGADLPESAIIEELGSTDSVDLKDISATCRIVREAQMELAPASSVGAGLFASSIHQHNFQQLMQGDGGTNGPGRTGASDTRGPELT